MDNRTNTHRLRTNVMLRMGTEKQSLGLKGESKKPLEKLEVKIPRPLQQQLAPRVDHSLRPIQTNLNINDRSRKPLKPIIRNTDPLPAPDPVKKTKHINKTYKLVEEKDVPANLVDTRHDISYKKLNFLGVGAFAKVYRIEDKDGKFYAAKIVSKASINNEKLRNKLLSEISIHRVLKHDYIVKFNSCFEDDFNVYLVLEFCKNKTLCDMLRVRKVLTEHEVRYYMGQILSALRYMSDNRVLHRDLKLGNVLLDENMDCKLGDFGLAALLLNKEDRRTTICGTPHYIAPEVLFNKEGHNHRADMWSAGILMYNLLFGKHPFHHEQAEKLYQQVRQNERRNEYSFPVKYTGYEAVSENAKDLIRKLLVNNPDDRLSVIEALEHSFFTDFKMPLQIPVTSLYRIPDYEELFGDEIISSQSKVDDAIRRARDTNESYIDNRINPPLNIMSEVIVDPRTQYPIKKNSSQPIKSLVIPIHSTSETTSKKRSNAIQSAASKRVCSDQDMKAEPNQIIKLKRTDLSKVLSKNVTVKSAVDKTRPFAVPLPVTHRKSMMEDMADNLKVMIERGDALPTHQRTESLQEDDKFEWHANNIFVQNWIDCTKKYGFSYRFSDGTMGFLYNDGSTMTTVDNKTFYYLYKSVGSNIYIGSTYEHDQVPQELRKKRDVLNSFKKYAVDCLLPIDFSLPQATEVTSTHLFKYLVSDSGITFRLNNGVIQFNFFKSVKLILYEKGRKLIYIDKHRKLHCCNTMDALKSNEQELISAIRRSYKILQEQNLQRKNELRSMRWERMSKDYPTTSNV